MDKNTAANTINNAGIGTYDIAESIYLATVEGVSGANQNQGYGFALSAIAELWNIRGSIGNPNGRTKITGRYKGMGVTEDMILNVILQYPNGFSGRTPLFDDLLGVGSGGSRGMGNYPSNNTGTNTGGNENVSNIDLMIAIVTFIILKVFVGWGWILSLVVAFVVGGIVDTLRRRG